ncbi:hypothetical protein ACFXB3_15295 [Streptomyces sp. NPDC059447]|uniref:hypothetical protein n=1 Tax=unclassified Streptomyces TaxID=2593676 RepID=UPI0036B18B22
MSVNTNIAWIRRLFFRLVTAPAGAAGGGCVASSVPFEPGPVAESVEPGAGAASAPPWVSEMAAPSFMIVSPRLPRR